MRTSILSGGKGIQPQIKEIPAPLEKREVYDGPATEKLPELKARPVQQARRVQRQRIRVASPFAGYRPRFR